MPKADVTMVPENKMMDLLEQDIGFDLERLFDHYNFDHIPSEKRLNLFKKRDLARVLYYKTAAKIFGAPSSRTRVHIAPPMETQLKHQIGSDDFTPPPSQILSSLRKSPPDVIKSKTKEEMQKEEEEEKIAHYKSQIAKRKQRCIVLDNLTEGYLARKHDKSELEKRIQAKYKARSLLPSDVSPPEVILPPKDVPEIPIMTVPPPNGLQILDKFLSLNHMRLIDLFATADKDKNWSLSKEEFVNAVAKAEIPLTESEVDAMIVTLDADLDNKLTYQDLNKGLQMWRKQRRIIKSMAEEEAEMKAFGEKCAPEGEAKIHPSDIRLTTTGIEFGKDTLSYGNLNNRYTSDDMVHQHEDPLLSVRTVPNKEEFTEIHDKMEISTKESRPESYNPRNHSCTSTPNSLEPPEPDLRKKAQIPVSAEEEVDISKHNRFVLKRNRIQSHLPREKCLTFVPGVIKVGYKPIDDHCSESTLGGETADMVNEFRRVKLKEYFDVKKHFEEKGLPFTSDILDRVLLYPGDKPTTELRRKAVVTKGLFSNEQSSVVKLKSSRNNTIGRQSSRGLRPLDRTPVSIDGSVKYSHQEFLYTSSSKAKDSIDHNSAQDHDVSERILSSAETRRGSKKMHGSHAFDDGALLASALTPKSHSKDLSSSTPLVSHKKDNRMTCQEYSRYTKKLPNRFRHSNKKSNPDAVWPGYLLNKLRLYMDNDLTPFGGRGSLLKNQESHVNEHSATGGYGGTGNALFNHIVQPKRAYPGYNNDLLTWPVGQNGVRYGSIDGHRLVK